jgi:hypothetical protein
MLWVATGPDPILGAPEGAVALASVALGVAAALRLAEDCGRCASRLMCGFGFATRNGASTVTGGKVAAEAGGFVASAVVCAHTSPAFCTIETVSTPIPRPRHRIAELAHALDAGMCRQRSASRMSARGEIDWIAHRWSVKER